MSQRKFIDDYLLKMANAYKSAAAMISFFMIGSIMFSDKYNKRIDY